MEFPEMGQRCALTECQQLDFLPFPCQVCSLTFCKDHRAVHVCKREEPQVTMSSIPEQRPMLHGKCSMEGCIETTLVEIAGPADGRNYCIRHRHGSGKEESAAQQTKLKAWQIPKAQYKEAKKEVDRQVNESLEKAMKKEGKQQTALKVQLMRIKGRAVGAKQTPYPRRAYFLVHPPASGPGQGGKALHVDRDWTLGRAVDKVAEVLKARNDNNVASQPRLGLYRKMGGELVSGDLGMTVGDLLGSGGLIEGETLVLEYCTEGQTCLDNPQAYTDVDSHR